MDNYPDRRPSNGPRWDRIIIALILAAAIGTAGYFFYQFTKTQKEIAALKETNPAAKQAEQKKTALTQLSQMVELPPNEEPTLVTLTDVTKLTDQPFFQNAQNGDQVLIYKESKKAIIYRPDTKKIIDMAQVNLSDELKPSGETSSPSANSNPAH